MDRDSIYAVVKRNCHFPRHPRLTYCVVVSPTCDVCKQLPSSFTLLPSIILKVYSASPFCEHPLWMTSRLIPFQPDAVVKFCANDGVILRYGAESTSAQKKWLHSSSLPLPPNVYNCLLSNNLHKERYTGHFRRLHRF